MTAATESETLMSAAPADLRTAVAFSDKLDAEAGLARASALRQHAISGSLLLGTGGLVAAACVFAWGQRGPSPEELAAALAKLPPIAVKVDGNVGLKPDAAVALDDSATVRLAPGGTVRLADGGVVKLDASGLPDIAKLLKQQPAAPGKGTDGRVIKREVTVFTSVEMSSNRTVVSGWNFTSGDAEKPNKQYCYVSTPEKANSLSSRRVDIAFDHVPIEISRSAVADFDGALAKCAWWQGAA